MEHSELHLLRHGGGKALDVHFLRVQAHGLNEQLVPGLIPEADDLRLDGRAVARADGFNHAVKERRPVMVGLDDLVRFFVRIGQIADRLIFRRRLSRKREGNRVLIAGLQFHLRHINRAAVHARRRAGLEPAHPKAERSQLLRKADACLHPVRAGGIGAVAGDDACVQIRAGGDDAGLDGIDRAEARDDSGHMAVRQAKLRDHGLLEIKMLLPLKRALHILLIAPPVGLRAEGNKNKFYNVLSTFADKGWRYTRDGDGECLYKCYYIDGSLDMYRELNEGRTLWNPTDVTKKITHSYFIEDGSFLRCQDLTVGYTLPGNLTSKWGISKARFYVSASNLFIITGYSGYDPEVDIQTGLTCGMDYNRYPRSRSFVLGTNITF